MKVLLWVMVSVFACGFRFLLGCCCFTFINRQGVTSTYSNLKSLNHYWPNCLKWHLNLTFDYLAHYWGFGNLLLHGVHRGLLPLNLEKSTYIRPGWKVYLLLFADLITVSCMVCVRKVTYSVRWPLTSVYKAFPTTYSSIQHVYSINSPAFPPQYHYIYSLIEFCTHINWPLPVLVLVLHALLHQGHHSVLYIVVNSYCFSCFRVPPTNP